MLKLEKGRPADCAGRLEKEVRTYDFLDKLNIEYERIDHEAAMTMQECADVDEALGAMICKNLFLCNRQETTFYLLMIPGDKKFKTKDLSAQILSSRLSFAKETYMEEFLDITPGSVSVLGLMNDREHRVQLLVDRDVLEGDYIYPDDYPELGAEITVIGEFQSYAENGIAWYHLVNARMV